MSIPKPPITSALKAAMNASARKVVVASEGRKSILSSRTVLQTSSSGVLTKLATKPDTACLSLCPVPSLPPQIRWAHSDIEVPDFSAYRRRGTQNKCASSEPSFAGRRAFTYAIAGAGSMVGVYSTKTIMNEFIASMSASADVLALAKAEIKLEDIPLGKNVTFKWRGMPLFVRHRTPEEIQDAESMDHTLLRHPQKDSERVNDKEWLVVLGICTHLGCVPIANVGDYPGGYYCPCHGSHYDSSGRIRKGPAPLNLEVPEHSFPKKGILVVGSLN